MDKDLSGGSLYIPANHIKDIQLRGPFVDPITIQLGCWWNLSMFHSGCLRPWCKCLLWLLKCVCSCTSFEHIKGVTMGASMLTKEFRIAVDMIVRLDVARHVCCLQQTDLPWLAIGIAKAALCKHTLRTKVPRWLKTSCVLRYISCAYFRIKIQWLSSLSWGFISSRNSCGCPVPIAAALVQQVLVISPLFVKNVLRGYWSLIVLIVMLKQ